MFDMFDEIYDNGDQILEETMDVLMEANVVKMDKATLKKRLITQCTLIEAKVANDKLWQKYVKATKIRKKCRKLIQKKYEAKGKQRAKRYLAARKNAK